MTGFAVFDGDGALVATNGAFPGLDGTDAGALAGRPAAQVLRPVIETLRLFDGAPVKGGKRFAEAAIARWSKAETSPIEAHTRSGGRCLLTAHPGADGGRSFVSVDISSIEPEPAAPAESDDVFRCITQSHPLPVWMADEETGEILYESRAASEMLGRPWDPDHAQFITDHYVRPQDRDGVKAALGDNDLVYDHEVEFQDAGGNRFWISANVRRGTFQGRPALIAGMVDITDRKEKEDQFRFLLERHPMPVWANDADTGEILHISDSAKKMFGPVPKERTTLYVSDFFADPDQNRAIRELLLASGQIENHEVKINTLAGRTMWVSGAARLVQHGGRNMVIAGIMDITFRKEREEQIRFILEGHPLPMWMNDAQTGELLFESPATARMFGREWSREPKVSIHDHYVDMEDRKTLLAMLRRSGVVEGYESRWRKADGTQFWARGNVRLMDYQGREVVLAGILDVTEQKRREMELAEARALLSDAIESLSEGFALYDENMDLVMCNTRYREMNAAMADIIEPGMNWMDMVKLGVERGAYVDAQDDEDLWLGERARDAKRLVHNYELHHSDGRWYAVSNGPTQQGGFVVTRSDITERKQAEAARREADDMVRRVLEACPVMVMMNRLEDGRVIYRNPASTALFGEPQSVISFYANPQDRETYVEIMKAQGFVDDFEYDARRPNGDVFRASVSGRLIDYQGEQVIVSHTVDLTDRIAMEEELDRQREIVHQSEKLSALGGLLAGVAHELNNPLSIVVGQSLLLRETSDDPDTAARAEKIGKAADRCARIIKTFVAMARRQPARQENVSINEVLEAAIELAGYAIRSADIAVTRRLSPDLPPVWGDRDQLIQVFMNLLVNAGTALAEREADRRIKVVSRYDERAGGIVVKIEDNGPGIAEDIRSRIFEPFFTTREVGSGTGIGLAFCHRIVETHGGTIRVASRPGAYTAFFVRLPGSERKEDVPADGAGPAADEGRSPVLVIDDEADVAELIGDVLRGEGHEVCIATSVEQALEQLAGRPFGLILSDLNMPHLGGAQLQERLARETPDLVSRLAFVTGDTMSRTARAFLERSGRPFLEKPIRPDALRELVARLTAAPA